MIKVVANDSWNFDEPLTTMVKVASTGFGGHDRREFSKRASECMLSKVEKIARDLKPGDVLIHLLAMGATEVTGANRNGDGWKVATLKATHPTFVKYARFFRDHRNRDKAKSYGIVKVSDYNEPMGRVELCVALNGNKEAAQRNGGAVADIELQRLESGKSMPVSMSCQISEDECSWCKNRAKRSADYCRGTIDGGKCAAGGLYHKMGSLVEVDGEVHHLHADNPAPLTFFDISHIVNGRGADRIAFVTGELDRMHKAASEIRIKSADLAALWGIAPPPELYQNLYSPKTANYLHRLENLVSLEGVLKQAMPAEEFLLTAHGRSENPLPAVPDSTFARLMGVMVKHSVCLDPSAFVQVACGVPAEQAVDIATQIECRLSSAFEKLAHAPDLQYLVETSPYQPDNNFGYAESYWAVKLADDYGFSKEAIRDRSIRGSLRHGADNNIGRLKVATDTNETAEKLAMEYAMYQLTFLSSIPETNFPLTAKAIIAQNQRT